MKVEGGTNKGPVRATNQDAYDCGSFSKNAVWGIVCDGMGGANGGNVASSIAVDEIRKFIKKSYSENMSEGNIRAMLHNAVAVANRAIFEKSRQEPSLYGMGTTAIIMYATLDKLHVVHVGDSRVYLLSQGKIERLTTDHSFVQNLVDFGQITENEARFHPKRNIITRAVGVHEQVRCDYSTVDFYPGDVAAAFTDGLTDYATDELLSDFFSQYSGKQLIDQLLDFAVEAGSADNITVLLIEHE